MRCRLRCWWWRGGEFGRAWQRRMLLHETAGRSVFGDAVARVRGSGWVWKTGGVLAVGYVAIRHPAVITALGGYAARLIGLPAWVGQGLVWAIRCGGAGHGGAAAAGGADAGRAWRALGVSGGSGRCGRGVISDGAVWGQMKPCVRKSPSAWAWRAGGKASRSPVKLKAEGIRSGEVQNEHRQWGSIIRWVPAFAGMTEGWFVRFFARSFAGIPGAARNDDVGFIAPSIPHRSPARRR